MKQISQYYSDLHLEHHNSFPIIKKTQEDYPENLILAGDIGSPFTDNYWNFLKEESKLFDRVFLICGNHEYYGSTIDQMNKYISRQLRLSKLINVYFLNNEVFEIGDIKIIGTTLWSEIPKKYEKHVVQYMSDYKLIKNFTVDKANELYYNSVSFLERELKTDKKCIVISHHAPSFHNTSHKSYQNKVTTHAFASNLEHLVDKSVYWIFGHTHYNLIDHPKLKTNQCGYNLSSPSLGFKLPAYFEL